MTSTRLAAQELVAERSCRIPVPSVARCMLMIFVLKMALRCAGFDWTIGWIRRRVEGGLTDLAPGAGAMAAVEHAVAMAGALYPGRALCLEQSLTLCYYLRRASVDAHLRIGVQPRPFEAHAWVEHRGRIVNDIPERVRRFAVLPDPTG